MNTRTLKRLKKALAYCPHTGAFTWQVTRGKARAGQAAGNVWVFKHTSYLRITFEGRQYLAHRLAWLYQRGAWPNHQIDHRDRNGLNNAWANLRAATHGQNQANARRRNKSGYRGVCWDAGHNKWKAAITSNGRNYYLGRYDDPKEAYAAYCTAAREYHGQFADVE